MSNSPMPAYAVVQLSVKDHEEYLERYGKSVIEMFERIGAEVLAVSPAPKVLEGVWGGNWTVVIKFPSMAAADAWYGSAEYKPLLERRTRELTHGGNVVMVEGFDPAALGL